MSAEKLTYLDIHVFQSVYTVLALIQVAALTLFEAVGQIESLSSLDKLYFKHFSKSLFA